MSETRETLHEGRPTPLAQVREFHEKFGLPIGSIPALPDEAERNLRYWLLREEFTEYEQAEGHADLVGIADALGDMVCVIYGTALSYGIDLDAVVAEIHRSNMTKTRDESVSYPSKNIRKLDGYEPPRLAEVLALATAGCERHRGDPHNLCVPCMEAEARG